MTARTKIPINHILVQDRLREDYGEAEMEALMDSMETYGLIQPIVLDQNNRLIAGGRRYAAATALGWTEIDVVYRETMSEDELHELELEENLRRKEMTWQERVKSIKTIHRLKEKRAILDPSAPRWGMRQTGEMLGMALGKIQYAIQIATLLENGDVEVENAGNLSDALKVLMRRRENEAIAELAKRSMPPMVPVVTLGTPLGQLKKMSDEYTKDTEVFLAGQEQNALDSLVGSGATVALDSNKPPQVCLSSMLFTQPDMNSLSRIASMGPGICDHVITDPPYGIDMDMLQQDGGGMDVSEVRETHSVEENLAMILTAIPTMFSALKENGFCVFWCDIMNWHTLYECAINVGFKVQRWPIVWDKLHRCQNMAAQCNFTKSIEIAMVCRKGIATLVQPAPRCTITASNDDVKRRYGHAFAKPPALTEFIARHISLQGQTILEPFAGRGSIVIPLLEMGRKVIAVEYEKSVHFPYLVENVKQHFLKTNPNTQFV